MTASCRDCGKKKGLEWRVTANGRGRYLADVRIVPHKVLCPAISKPAKLSPRQEAQDWLVGLGIKKAEAVALLAQVPRTVTEVEDLVQQALRVKDGGT